MATLDLECGQSITLKITLHQNGALSVEGPVHDKAFCMAMLGNALDAVKNWRNKNDLVVPSHDVQAPAQKVYCP